MKIQELAIIFILIILPISLVLSAYTQYQIQTVNLQTQYDRQLTAATYDAIKAYQINAENSTTSELANSKIRDIEASVSTFKNSIMSAFRLNGYTEEDMNNYIPALVYTMYDGFYIYSPFNNNVDGNGNIIKDNVESVYGLKPYIPYSCRYKKGSIDVVITYALDNYITVQGTINGTDYINKSGYLIDDITISGENVTYNGITIETEVLKEYLEITGNKGTYSYVKLNGTKYYLYGDEIIYLSNGNVTVQCKKTSDYPDDDYGSYEKLIKNNDQAIQYYKNAKEFTDWLEDTDLNNLKWENAYDVDGNTQLWPNNSTSIFQDNKNSIGIENELSNFNQHRLSVIRNVIENNLSVAIANYNNYSGSTSNFQMPKLKEDEWDYITHNISMISFLQGMNIGGKVYNGYTIVTNSESKEVVLESNIYILGNDNYYHKIGDESLKTDGNVGNKYGDNKSAGRLNLDFKRKYIKNGDNSVYYYSLKDYNASYDSIIMENDVDAYDDIYAYINNNCSDEVKKAFYIALGRERNGKYNSTTNINELLPSGGETDSTPTPTPDPTPDPIPETTKYKIRFYLNGGSGIFADMEVEEGKSAELPNIEPTRDGHTFLGWSTSSGATTAQYASGQTITPTGDMTLYAVWGTGSDSSTDPDVDTSKTYAITFDANGGSGEPNSITGNVGETVTIPTEVPTRTMTYGSYSYKFKGWSSTKSSSTTGGWGGTTVTAEYQPGDTIILTNDMTLYAVWSYR